VEGIPENEKDECLWYYSCADSRVDKRIRKYN
jgi:hypothetical protein